MSTDKQHNAGAFILRNGVAEEISFPIPWSMVRADAEGILSNDHDLSRLRKDDHEKAIMTLCKRIQDDFPFALTDEQESRLIDFLVSNF